MDNKKGFTVICNNCGSKVQVMTKDKCMDIIPENQIEISNLNDYDAIIECKCGNTVPEK